MARILRHVDAFAGQHLVTTLLVLLKRFEAKQLLPVASGATQSTGATTTTVHSSGTTTAATATKSTTFATIKLI